MCEVSSRLDKKYEQTAKQTKRRTMFSKASNVTAHIICVFPGLTSACLEL